MTSDEHNNSSTAIPPAEQRLLGGVEPRIFRIMLVLGVLGTVVFLLWQGPGWAGGFAIGAALSGLSFHWMKSAVKTLSESATGSATEKGTPEPVPAPRGTGGAVLRFVLRYALIGIAGYVIFRSSVLSLAAFFAGLFVAVAAVLAEIAYEVVLSFRRT